MGRHSAPQDEEPDDSAVAAVALAPSPQGRHSRPDAEADAAASASVESLARADTGELARVTEAPAAPPGPAVARAAKPRPFAWTPGPRKPRPPTRSAWPPRSRQAPPPAKKPEALPESVELPKSVELAAPEDVTVILPAVEAPLLEQPVPADLTELIPPLEPETAEPAEQESGEPDAAEPEASKADTVTPEAATTTDAPAKSAPAVSAPTGGGHATSADLALLRNHGDVRARCLAGLLAPFVVYAVILLVIGSFTTRTVLLWLAAPIVLAGVLVGLFLDLGHRRHGTQAPTPDRVS